MDPIEDDSLINFSEESDLAWEKYSGKRSRFKAVLISASSNSNLRIEDLTDDQFSEVMSEWDWSDSSERTDFCICSQPIVHNYFMTNKFTGRTASIGSECIKKFGTSDQKRQIKVRLRMDKYKRTEGTKIMCCSCCKNKVESSLADDIPFCSSCSKQGHTKPSEIYLSTYGVLCSTCKNEKIMPDTSTVSCDKCLDLERIKSQQEQASKKKVILGCSSCGKEADGQPLIGLCWDCSSRHPGRQCSYCPNGKIPIVKPLNWKKCWDCYSQKKTIPSSVNRTCNKCKLANITSKYLPHQKMCWDCWRQSQS